MRNQSHHPPSLSSLYHTACGHIYILHYLLIKLWGGSPCLCLSCSDIIALSTSINLYLGLPQILAVGLHLFGQTSRHLGHFVAWWPLRVKEGHSWHPGRHRAQRRGRQTVDAVFPVVISTSTFESDKRQVYQRLIWIVLFHFKQNKTISRTSNCNYEKH